ncbi:hypothetical protein [Alteromonas oceanisediminis]|uniref:hypothetical protein n=1 Tax=Alteromonas oceanisediminis TaxID=2836180 RepID=UPI001BD92464|nr:hypothetical protein [Alteromonas oceanisediminis]MBT0585925.1 hypothetical protein [Alteromonas oceanisediminis]
MKLPIYSKAHYDRVGYTGIMMCFLITYVVRPQLSIELPVFVIVMGSSVSFFATVAAIFLLLSHYNQRGNIVSALFIVFGCMLYECVQPYLGLGVFDIFDLTAIAIAGFISMLGISLAVSDVEP